jgi:hypothetical protein
MGNRFEVNPMTTDRDQRTISHLLACHPHAVDDPERGWASAGCGTLIDVVLDLATPAGRAMGALAGSLADRLASTRLIGPAWPGFEVPWLAISSLAQGWPEPALQRADGPERPTETTPIGSDGDLECPEPADRAA